MKINRFRLAILPVILSAALVLTGCPQQVSLARIAPTIEPLAVAFVNELPALLQTKVIDQPTFDKLTALDIAGRGKLLGDFLKGVSAINAGNKQEVLDKLDEGIRLFVPLTGLAKPGSKAAGILAALTTGLNLYRTAIAIMQPPAASFAISTDGKPDGIATSGVKVTLPKMDRATKDALAAAGVK